MTDTDRQRSGRVPVRRWRIPVLIVVAGLTLATCGGDGDGGGPLGGSLPGGTIGSGTGVIEDGSEGAEATLPATDNGEESAGGSDGQTGGEDVATDGDTEVSPPPPPIDPVDPVDLDDGTDDGLSTEQWVLLIVAAVVGIAVIAGLAAMANGRSRDRRQRQMQSQERRDQIVGGCRWVHDQAALTVLSTSDPAMLRSTWTTVEGQLLELESSIAAAQAQAEGGADADLAGAGRAVSAVRGALAADVAARSGTVTPAPEIVAQTRQTVLDRNRELEAATVALSVAQV
jgi:hypothetical protein